MGKQSKKQLRQRKNAAAAATSKQSEEESNKENVTTTDTISKPVEDMTVGDMVRESEVLGKRRPQYDKGEPLTVSQMMVRALVMTAVWAILLMFVHFIGKKI